MDGAGALTGVASRVAPKCFRPKKAASELLHAVPPLFQCRKIKDSSLNWIARESDAREHTQTQIVRTSLSPTSTKTCPSPQKNCAATFKESLSATEALYSSMDRTQQQEPSCGPFRWYECLPLETDAFTVSFSFGSRRKFLFRRFGRIAWGGQSSPSFPEGSCRALQARFTARMMIMMTTITATTAIMMMHFLRALLW